MSKKKGDNILFNPSRNVANLKQVVGPRESTCPVGPKLLEEQGQQGRDFQDHLIGCSECRQKYAH
ncbi:MAG: hypothetical protein AAB785_00065 [Patescibacteria group bacterium]